MSIFTQGYVDEDVDILVAHLLVAKGFDVKTVRSKFANSGVYVGIIHRKLIFSTAHSISLH
jgi:ATP-dependent protease Clp ATPase subunit